MKKVIVIVIVLFVWIDVIQSLFMNTANNESVADKCYFCYICPRPFRPDDIYVSIVTSPTGWCALKSLGNESYNAYSQGAAEPGLCHEEGCSWTVADEAVEWVCCCNQHLCNTGFPVPENTTTTITPTTTPITTTSTTSTTTTTMNPTTTAISSTTTTVSTTTTTINATTTAHSGTSLFKSTILLLISALTMSIIA